MKNNKRLELTVGDADVLDCFKMRVHEKRGILEYKELEEMKEFEAKNAGEIYFKMCSRYSRGKWPLMSKCTSYYEIS